jgi:hypothetical protein
MGTVRAAIHGAGPWVFWMVHGDPFLDLANAQCEECYAVLNRGTKDLRNGVTERLLTRWDENARLKHFRGLRTRRVFRHRPP